MTLTHTEAHLGMCTSPIFNNDPDMSVPFGVALTRLSRRPICMSFQVVTPNGSPIIVDWPEVPEDPLSYVSRILTGRVIERLDPESYRVKPLFKPASEIASDG